MARTGFLNVPVVVEYIKANNQWKSMQKIIKNPKNKLSKPLESKRNIDLRKNIVKIRRLLLLCLMPTSIFVPHVEKTSLLKPWTMIILICFASTFYKKKAPMSI